MSTKIANRSIPRKSGLSSFTLIELLTVIAIIAILAALILYAGNGVMQKAMRSRAASDVQAMSTGLEGYKTDNGIYPPGDGTLLLTNTPYTNAPISSYQTNSTLLYIALSGQSNFDATPVAGSKAYMSFKANQIGNPAATYSYIKDPWNNSYGYSTGTTNGAPSPQYPYNGNGFFDLWSTGNQATNMSAWLSNWQ